MGAHYSYFSPTPTTYQLTATYIGGCFGGEFTFSTVNPPSYLVPSPIPITEWKAKIDRATEIMSGIERGQRIYMCFVFAVLILLALSMALATNVFSLIFWPFFIMHCTYSSIMNKKRQRIIVDITNLFSSWKERGITVRFYIGNKRSVRCLGFDYSALVSANPTMWPVGEQAHAGGRGRGPPVVEGIFASASPPPQQQQPIYYSSAQPIYASAQLAPTVSSSSAAPVPPYASVTTAPKPQVQVLVPSYGGGGPSMVPWNGTYISVDIPHDAAPGSTITMDVPHHYY